MRRIREILLTQYIGAIVIGMLLVQALTGVVSLLVQPIVWYQQVRESRSVVASGLPPFPWARLLPLALSVTLYLVVSWLLIAWIYRDASVRQLAGDPEKLPAERD